MLQIYMDFYSYFVSFWNVKKQFILASNSRAAGNRSDKNLKLVWKYTIMSNNKIKECKLRQKDIFWNLSIL